MTLASPERAHMSCASAVRWFHYHDIGAQVAEDLSADQCAFVGQVEHAIWTKHGTSLLIGVADASLRVAAIVQQPSVWAAAQVAGPRRGKAYASVRAIKSSSDAAGGSFSGPTI